MRLARSWPQEKTHSDWLPCSIPPERRVSGYVTLRAAGAGDKHDGCGRGSLAPVPDAKEPLALSSTPQPREIRLGASSITDWTVAGSPGLASSFFTGFGGDQGVNRNTKEQALSAKGATLPDISADPNIKTIEIQRASVFSRHSPDQNHAVPSPTARPREFKCLFGDDTSICSDSAVISPPKLHAVVFSKTTLLASCFFSVLDGRVVCIPQGSRDTGCNVSINSARIRFLANAIYRVSKQGATSIVDCEKALLLHASTVRLAHSTKSTLRNELTGLGGRIRGLRTIEMTQQQGSAHLGHRSEGTAVDSSHPGDPATFAMHSSLDIRSVFPVQRGSAGSRFRFLDFGPASWTAVDVIPIETWPLRK
ncbi:predicted protein [Uncinocarpus reesii 1704]|uniref:Uncharacterized protein n=1 Tax=Uncinocarpus reesii (strain UAMH 1704) TaxID=336963 RepID=C4JLW6_UNCRE|nr:uncharacterized protein UREG_03824 [Uncinocarpus reesii 1704]EEP78978.1 predicted protein [Uncinocarpus reesii 1704]